MIRITLAVSLAGTLPAYTQEDRPDVPLIIADDIGGEASNYYDLRDQRATMPVIKGLCG